MIRLLIKNGRIIDPASGFDAVADVALEDGRIAGLGVDLNFAGAEIFDATGRPSTILTRRLAHPCLDTFMRALPFTLRSVEADRGSVVASTELNLMLKKG